jgi:hypothetical protein
MMQSPHISQWFDNPGVLFNNVNEIFPNSSLSAVNNNNALARLIIIFTFIRTAINRSNVVSFVLEGGMLLLLARFSAERKLWKVPTSPDSKLLPTVDANMGHYTEPTISEYERNRMAIGTQSVSQATFRPSNKTLIYATHPLKFTPDDDSVIVDNTVGTGKFVSRLK